MSLEKFLIKQKKIGIAGIDTRHLTSLIRTHGAMKGAIVAGGNINPDSAIKAAQECSPLTGLDVAKQVSAQSSYGWTEGTWSSETDDFKQVSEKKFNVYAYDFGIKRNILRILAEKGCQLTIVPAQTPASEVLHARPDGVFLSNGPGDPAACDYAISATREFLKKGIPLFGICLGYQILALASGARTEKMKFGHHGANHPVKDLKTGRILISSQNHGFAVSKADLPACLEVTHTSLFDQSLQGIARKDVPAFGFQGHPEASPGPHDMAPLFDRFITIMKYNQM